ncbi:hypothetical protein K0U27_00580 [archaeon]|nr:hypothetical protein [archaeon]
MNLQQSIPEDSLPCDCEDVDKEIIHVSHLGQILPKLNWCQKCRDELSGLDGIKIISEVSD